MAACGLQKLSVVSVFHLANPHLCVKKYYYMYGEAYLPDPLVLTGVT